MYKVFINEVPVFFTEINTSLTSFKSVLYQELDCQFLFHEISKNPEVKINVICDNLENDWLNFLLNFQVREAAGGVVKNKAKDLLWIYRFDKWDLPKGHIEKGESKNVAAIREVEEECNVSGLVIDKELQTTYHVFEHKGNKVMKVTYWFLMHTTIESQTLVPQTEEGITAVCFKNSNDSLKCLSNTYGNIKLLMEEIL
ncbi:ADP-ribose pyrophosphatase YjhB (NUDIX family) [Wenyingzhuangia heitensis]|uniref:ADP-ribose pyrophosphatase YjhB (NUDIX family) n=1 Tax=Wenyingzhuangia heitensis TaxID=1487859 RepID=A0ABX0UCE8_9FLAO|nr:NUDIX domain-containing protein [Wenyingzhuangia heitensis]NIJ46008.1 ADP-ribose pyrophosphatase YjhB (NUDIX family) [Wenyingzhuangia heitensis]